MRLNKYLFNRVNNKEREHGQRSVVWLKRGQPCLHHLHVLSTVFSWRPFSSFSLWIILLPPSLPPTKFSTVKSVWRVPGSIGVGAQGWRVRVCQPWGHNFFYGLAVPKVEAPGHPGHPPPLSNAVVNHLWNNLTGKGNIYFASSDQNNYNKMIKISHYTSISFPPMHRVLPSWRACSSEDLYPLLLAILKWLKLIIYINTNEIPGELLRKNMISSHVKITCYLHTWKDHHC